MRTNPFLVMEEIRFGSCGRSRETIGGNTLAAGPI